MQDLLLFHKVLGYRPFSAYVWIGACYDFRRQLQIEIRYSGAVATANDIPNLCVMKTVSGDGPASRNA